MKDKITTGLLAALVVAPVCLLCLLGPAVLGGGLTWLSVWLGGLGWGAAGLAAGLAAILVLALLLRRRAKAGRHPLAFRPFPRE